MKATTIKVPTSLRERVQAHAQRQRLSQAAVLEKALDLLDREEFFAQLAQDVAQRGEAAADVAEREAWLAGPVAIDNQSDDGIPT
ncbi:MAG: hypothetical protein WC184_08915 [Acidimicrobiia bacterium]